MLALNILAESVVFGAGAGFLPLRRIAERLSFFPREPEGPLPIPDYLISVSSPVGASLLSRAEISADYLRLMPHYVPQKTPKLCGPATLAIVLNALEAGRASATAEPRPRFDQDNVFDDRTEAVKARSVITAGGMGLDILAGFFELHAARSAITYANASSLERFRVQGVAALEDPDHFLVVNYRRAVLGQQGTGHISPVAAYDHGTDSFLILDVSWRRYPSVWVPAGRLFDAMNTSAGRNWRGFLVVGR